MTVVFILEVVELQFLLLLSALRWMRIRGLCKIPDGKDWLWGKLSLALDAEQGAQDWKRLLFIAISKKAMPKNVQTTIQLHSFHILTR